MATKTYSPRSPCTYQGDLKLWGVIACHRDVLFSDPRHKKFNSTNPWWGWWRGGCSGLTSFWSCVKKNMVGEERSVDVGGGGGLPTNLGAQQKSVRDMAALCCCQSQFFPPAGHEIG